MFRKSIMMATVALAASLGSTLIGGAPASADSQVSKIDIEHLRTNLTKYDVPAKTQDALLEDFIKGERWDSETDANPVSSETERVDGVERTVYRYQDGSIGVSTVDIPSESTGESSILGITGCQSYAVAGAKAWRNCRVSWDVFSWSVSFTAAYKYYLGPSYGCYIDSIGGLVHGGVGSFSSPKLSYITRSASGFTGTCVAQGTWTRKATDLFSETVGVRLNLSAQHGGGWTSKVSS
ncbi:hypothetical protein [Salinispora arenicola]|uniref:hypothetical protein n=1 Tax=Salinispora arenicola TaxID=168697 RepID=UPI0012BC761E|nr:hypothetical protein [Salinispora arenicola]